jgi:hypothetical protein
MIQYTIQIIQYLNEHKEDIVAAGGSVHIGLTTIYLYLKHEGGLRTIWSNILGPKISSVIPTEDKQKDKQA